MNSLIALFLDLSNIFGGLILAFPLFARIPSVGGGFKDTKSVDKFAWIVGVVALVTGGYFFIMHLINGGHILHYEVVAIIVGLLLMLPMMGQTIKGDGPRLFVAIFGIIAILVGLQGLFT